MSYKEIGTLTIRMEDGKVTLEGVATDGSLLLVSRSQKDKTAWTLWCKRSVVPTARDT